MDDEHISPGAIEKINKSFIEALMMDGPAAAACEKAATNYTRARLLGGYVMWGDTAALNRKVMDNLSGDAPTDIEAYRRLRELHKAGTECISKRDYSIWFIKEATGKEASPCPIPEDARQGNRIES